MNKVEDICGWKDGDLRTTSNRLGGCQFKWHGRLEGAGVTYQLRGTLNASSKKPKSTRYSQQRTRPPAYQFGCIGLGMYHPSADPQSSWTNHHTHLKSSPITSAIGYLSHHQPAQSPPASIHHPPLGRIHGPNPRARPNIKNPMRGIQRRHMQLPLQQHQKAFMVDIKPVLLRLVRRV